jgi:hypothetical protein
MTLPYANNEFAMHDYPFVLCNRTEFHEQFIL